MQLSEAQKKHLRGLGHRLKPVLMIGEAGLTESVMSEFLASIDHHELIKVRVRAGDRQQRDEIISRLCDTSGASLVTRIGNVALVFRQKQEKSRIKLPAGRHS